MNHRGYIKWFKWMVVLGAFAAAGLRLGLWNIDSPTPRAANLPAKPPIALADLKQALDAEFAPVVKDGRLRESTGCGKSTTEDLLTWLDANLHPDRYAAGAAPGSPGATLPAAFALDHQLRGMVKPNTEVAFSWLYNVESGRFEHGGTMPGYTAHVEFSPAHDRGIAVLYNRMDELPGQRRFVDRVADNINELMSGKPAARIDVISEDDPALAALDRANARYIIADSKELMAKERATADAMAARMAQTLGIDDIASVRDSLQVLIGTPDDIKKELAVRIEKFGMTYFFLNFMMPDVAEMFAKEVAPAFTH